MALDDQHNSNGDKAETSQPIEDGRTADSIPAALPNFTPADEALDGRRKVHQYMKARGIVAQFDGSLRQNISRVDDLDAQIRKTTITRQWLEDEFSLSPSSVGLNASTIKRLIRRVIDDEERNRIAQLATPLFESLDEKEQRRASDMWHKLATVFQQDHDLTIAKLQHFMWQVKRKTGKMKVTRHMMVIIVGAKQGTGKTALVDRLCAPWEESATGPVLISDITDARSADIFRFPIAKIDDMEKVERDKIGVLKSVITGGNLRRRMLGTMSSTGFIQAVTLIGTANHDIQELVDDDSGHRRFASLTMQEYTGAADSNPYWRIVNETDFALLWRSVAAGAAAPIEPFLSLLEHEQKSGALKTSLLAWLQGLDVNGEAVVQLATNNGLGATAVYELFVSQTGSLMSQTEFGLRMRRYAGRDDVPFGTKRKTAEKNVYPLKPKRLR